MKTNQGNNTTEIQNLLSYGIYQSWFYQLYRNAFKVEGLPFETEILRDVTDLLFRKFAEGKRIGLIRRVDDGFLLGDVTPASGTTWFGGYTTYNLTTLIESITVIRNDIAILQPPYMQDIPTLNYASIIDIINHFAYLCYLCDSTIRVNLQGQNTPAIIAAPAGQELTWSNIYEQVAGHKAVVFGREANLLKNDNDLRTIAFQDPAKFVSLDIEQVKSMIISDFLFVLGINNRTVTKRAQVIESEVMQDAATISVIRNAYQTTFDDFAEQANEKFGLNVKFSYNDDSPGNLALLANIINKEKEGEDDGNIA